MECEKKGMECEKKLNKQQHHCVLNMKVLKQFDKHNHLLSN